MRGKSFALLCLAVGPAFLNPVAQSATGLGLLYVSGSSAVSFETFQLGPKGVPQRVDYRDQANAFDLDLLGVATGMCSLAGDCDVCAYRLANPCQVADRFGADTALCQLPSFLGGNVTSSELCGGGATVDVILKPSADTAFPDSAAPGGSGSSSSLKPLVAATLTAFRTRAGALVLTITARCGWLLVPYNSTAGDFPGCTQAACPEPDAVILHGTLFYGGVDIHFAAPAMQQQQLGGGGGRERYSCYSAVLPLHGLSSSCQSMEIDVTVRLAVHAVALLPTSAPKAESEVEAEAAFAGSDAVTCEEVSPVLAAEASFTMRPPQAARRVQAAEQAASEAEAALAAEVDQLQQSRQRLFSNGVAVTASYKAVLDPRTAEATAWLDSLGRQFPVVAATQTHQRMSFLVGTLAWEAAEADVGLAAAAAFPGAAPLFPSETSLEGCDQQSADTVASAVISALRKQGVTEQHVLAVTCLKAPYLEVPYTELPPCAGGTHVLFNVSIEMPLGSSGGADGSSGLRSGSSTSDPRVLADTLVRSHMAAPWSCLSTEGQMRMATIVQLNVQLPKGPGLQEVAVGGIPQLPLTTTLLFPPSTGQRSPPPGTSAADGAAGGDSGGVSAAALTSSGDLSRSSVVIVSVAVAVAVFAVLVAIFAVRAVRQIKAEAHGGAGVAAGSVCVGAGAAAPLPSPHPLREFSAPAVKSSQPSASTAPPLGAKASYFSQFSGVDGGRQPFPPADMRMSHHEWLRLEQQQLSPVPEKADAPGGAATRRQPSAADVPLAAATHQQGAIPWAGLGVWAGGFGGEAAGGAAARSASTNPRAVGGSVGTAHAVAAAAATAAADSSGTTEGDAWAAASGGSSSTYDSRVAFSPSSSQDSLEEGARVRDRSDEADIQRLQKGKKDAMPGADGGSASSGAIAAGSTSMGARCTAHDDARRARLHSYTTLRPCTPPSGSTSPVSNKGSPARVSAVVFGPDGSGRPLPVSSVGRLDASRMTLSFGQSGGGYSAASSPSSSRRHDGDDDEGHGVKFGCTGTGRPLGRTGRFLYTVARALGSGHHQRPAHLAGVSAVAVAASKATLWSNVLYDSQLRNQQYFCEIDGEVEAAAKWAGQASIGIGRAGSCVRVAVDSDDDGNDGEGGCSSLVTAGAEVGDEAGLVRGAGTNSQPHVVRITAVRRPPLSRVQQR